MLILDHVLLLQKGMFRKVLTRNQEIPESFEYRNAIFQVTDLLSLKYTFNFSYISVIIITNTVIKGKKQELLHPFL
jgi:hypothetical protein